MTQVRVLVADGDEEQRILAEVLLVADGRFRVVGAATDGHAAVSLAARLQPDLVVLALGLAHLDDVRAVALVRQRAPHCEVLVHSAVPDPLTLLDLVGAGAAGYIDGARLAEELVPMAAAVRTARAGDAPTASSCRATATLALGVRH